MERIMNEVDRVKNLISEEQKDLDGEPGEHDENARMALKRIEGSLLFMIERVREGSTELSEDERKKALEMVQKLDDLRQNIENRRYDIRENGLRTDGKDILTKLKYDYQKIVDDLSKQ
ncbi:MAG: hypothetical protein R6V01_03845 [Thermoplasmatota archaeon]